MMAHCNAIASEASAHVSRRFYKVKKKLKKKSAKIPMGAYNPYHKAYEKLVEWISLVPLVGFNSGRYDLNMAKKYLIPFLNNNDNPEMIIKRGNNYLCIKLKNLLLIDIINFLAPGYSYDNYIRAYAPNSDTKGFFPYEWFDSLEKLNHEELPPIEAFSSRLRGTTLATQDYVYIQNVWDSLPRDSDGKIRFRQFLIWYNNLDVQVYFSHIISFFNHFANLVISVLLITLLMQ